MRLSMSAIAILHSSSKRGWDSPRQGADGVKASVGLREEQTSNAQSLCGMLNQVGAWKQNGQPNRSGWPFLVWGWVLYLTVNFAVAVLVSEPETPVNVMTYVPGVEFFGNRIPDNA